MKKRILTLIMAAAMAFGMTACLDDEDWDDDYYDDSGYYEDGGSWYGGGQGNGGNGAAGEVKGLKISVDEATGELSVERPVFEQTADRGPDDMWTILVYLCGADLESDGGMATDDLEEMLAAETGDHVRFLVQTGGASYWFNDEINEDRMQRFLVQDGDLKKVDEGSASSMGKASTLADFLTYGATEYPSEHMGVILWNHGGGSISGVCFDELRDDDALILTELDSAFYDSASRTGRKFDFIGFDACLMGTVETANVLATYADYMIGSQELEPGSGWDYTEIGEYIAKNSDANGAAVGRVVCDSFLAACEAQDDSDLTTLSVVNLSGMDELLKRFNTFAKEMYEAGQDPDKRAGMVRAIEGADNFGGNNKSEGYTNMVDLGGILDACSSYVKSAGNAKSALVNALEYQVTGSTHKGASGLSMYYPLKIEGSKELATFGKICISPYYLSFVDNKNHSGVSGSVVQDYDEGQWFDDNGEWYWGFDEWDDSNWDSYWDYLDDYEPTGESPYITFYQKPEMDDDGNYCFILDDYGYDNAASVSALVYELTEDADIAIELGETLDIYEDWEGGYFADNFDGYWISLPDGQNLAIYFADFTEDYVIYTSPIMLNGTETNLRIKQYFSDGSVVVEGAWDGIDEETGAACRDIVKIKNGDVIVPLYYAFSTENDDEFMYEGGEYEVPGRLEIYYDLLEEADYLYCFCIDDIYGDYLITDMALLGVDEDGNVYFYEE